MTNKALERAQQRDMMRALAGEPIVIGIHGPGDSKRLRNLAKHLPGPYRGDVEAMVMIWLDCWPSAKDMMSDRLFPYATVHMSSQVIVAARLVFDGLGDLVRFVYWLDSLEAPPVVKCGRCKQWVAASEANWLGSDWPDPGYYCRGCLSADSVREAFAHNPEWYFPLPTKGLWRP